MSCAAHCSCMHCMWRGAASGRAQRQLAILPLHLCITPSTPHPPALRHRPWVGRGRLGHPCHHDAGGRRLLWPIPGRQPGTTGLHNEWPSQQLCRFCAPAWRVDNFIVAGLSQGAPPPPLSLMPHRLLVSHFSAGHLPLRHGPRGNGLCWRGGRRSHAGVPVAGWRGWQLSSASCEPAGRQRWGADAMLDRLLTQPLPCLPSLFTAWRHEFAWAGCGAGVCTQQQVLALRPRKGDGEGGSGGGWDASTAAAALLLLRSCCCLRFVARHR